MMAGFTAIHILVHSVREQGGFLLSGSPHFYLGRTTAGINFGILSNYFSVCKVSSKQNGYIGLQRKLLRQFTFLINKFHRIIYCWSVGNFLVSTSYGFSIEKDLGIERNTLQHNSSNRLFFYHC